MNENLEEPFVLYCPIAGCDYEQWSDELDADDSDDIALPTEHGPGFHRMEGGATVDSDIHFCPTHGEPLREGPRPTNPYTNEIV